MPAKYENKFQGDSGSVWVGRYRQLHNLPHWHLAHELVACRSGRARVVLNGREYVLEPGDAALLSSGSIHYIDSLAEGELLVAQIDASLTDGMTDQVALVSPAFADRYDVAACLELMHRELTQKPPYYEDRLKAACIFIMIDLLRNEEQAQPTAAMSATNLMRYKHLVSQIQENFEFISFGEAAELMHMSEAYFSRFFKKISGMTFSAYLNLVKVDHAIELLRADPDYPTSDLMLECGFNTLRHFHRVFKDITGYSPARLPRNFSHNTRNLPADGHSFDPTLPTTVLY